MIRRPPRSPLFPSPPLFRPPAPADGGVDQQAPVPAGSRRARGSWLDRKSTRLNSSHRWISYAVFCLKKKRLRPLGQAPSQPTRLRQLPRRRAALAPCAAGSAPDVGAAAAKAAAARSSIFFLNDTAPTEIYPLSLPAALPI